MRHVRNADWPCGWEDRLVPADRASDVYDLEVDIQARRIRFLELLFDSAVAAHAGGGAADTQPHVLTLRRGDDIAC